MNCLVYVQLVKNGSLHKNDKMSSYRQKQWAKRVDVELMPVKYWSQVDHRVKTSSLFIVTGEVK